MGARPPTRRRGGGLAQATPRPTCTGRRETTTLKGSRKQEAKESQWGPGNTGRGGPPREQEQPERGSSFKDSRPPLPQPNQQRRLCSFNRNQLNTVSSAHHISHVVICYLHHHNSTFDISHAWLQLHHYFPVWQRMSLFEQEAWSTSNLLRQRGPRLLDSDSPRSRSAMKLIAMNLRPPPPLTPSPLSWEDPAMCSHGRVVW